jgi:hypothetical protein
VHTASADASRRLTFEQIHFAVAVTASGDLNGGERRLDPLDILRGELDVGGREILL